MVPTHGQRSRGLTGFHERARDWLLSPGDPGALPVTKFGGIPWWPTGVDRPECIHGHKMSFITQVRLADVPGWETDTGLLSFHYCLTCMENGDSSFGWDDAETRGYSVTIWSLAEHSETDGFGEVSESSVNPYTVSFYDYALPVDTSEPDEDWYADADPDDAIATRETVENDRQLLELRQEYGLVLPGPTPPLPVSDFDVGTENLYQAGANEFKLGVGGRSRLSGPPLWMQGPEYPKNSAGELMLFVAQIDWVLGYGTAWGGGGYAYLFTDPPDKAARAGELVISVI